jgi:hypothetical protein
LSSGARREIGLERSDYVKTKKTVGVFSRSAIRRYLAEKTYEKRGLTRQQYIKKCRDAWNKVEYDPKYERKVIVDFAEPVTAAHLFGLDAVDVDFVDSAVSELPMHGFETKVDIECIVFRAVSVHGGSNPLDPVSVDEMYRPAQAMPEPESLEERLYVLAMFDVLGFSALVAAKGAASLLSTYQSLIDQVLLNTKYTSCGRIRVDKNSYRLGGFYAPVSYTYFSDTILLWTAANFTYISPFLAKCADLVCEALKIGMPLRGSVCLGPAVMNKTANTFVGLALVEASEIEKNQRWIGATLGSGFMLNAAKDTLSETLVVPLFCEHLKKEMKVTFPYLTLDWVRRWRVRQQSDLVSVLKDLKDRAPLKNKIYYDNTIDFVRYVDLDSPEARAAFLHAKGYRVRNLLKVKLDALDPRQPIVLKVKDDSPHSGHILNLPTEVLDASPGLRELFDTNILFVKRLDYPTFVASLPTEPGVGFNLAASGVVLQVAKANVEYVDVFNLDPSEERDEGDVSVAVIE